MAALALSACDSGKVPSPAERQAGGGTDFSAIDPSLVLLKGDGLSVGAEAFYFADGQTEVEAALARSLGKASDTADMPECGAGPMVSSSYSGGLTVNFQNGSLAGWNVRDGAANIVLDGEVGIGTPRSQVEARGDFLMIDDSTLGDEFAIGDDLGGFFEDDGVSMLYAGTQCFFR